MEREELRAKCRAVMSRLDVTDDNAAANAGDMLAEMLGDLIPLHQMNAAGYSRVAENYKGVRVELAKRETERIEDAAYLRKFLKLEVLDNHEVPATGFINGQKIGENDLLRLMVILGMSPDEIPRIPAPAAPRKTKLL